MRQYKTKAGEKMEAEHPIINEIISKTNSELILFFIIVSVVLVLVFVPMYRMMIKERKERLSHENTRQDKYIEREKQIIAVITANTEVVAGLKTTLEFIRTDMGDSIKRINTRIDDIFQNDSTHTASIVRVQATLDEILRNEQKLLSILKGDK